MANTNLTTASCTIVADHAIWAGVQDGSNTDWLQSPIGQNAAIGATSMMVIDLTLDQGEDPTVFDLADTSIKGVSGTRVIALLGLTNLTEGARPPASETIVGGRVVFTGGGSSGVGDGDVVRATILYR